MKQTRRYEVIAGFPITAGLMVLMAWLLAHTVLRGITPRPEEIEAVRRTLLPDLREYLKPEPVERWLFIILSLGAPLWILAGFALARRLMPAFTARVHLAPRGWALLAMLAGGLGVHAMKGPSLFPYFVFPASPYFDLGILCVAAGLLWIAARGRGGRARGAGHVWRWAVVLLALLVTVLPRGMSVRSILSTREISDFGWQVHVQAAAYSLTQVFAGKPLLTAAPPLYGFNAEFLLPLFKLTGLSVFKFCVVMGFMQAGALAAVLMIAVHHVRLPAVRLLCCAGLIYYLGCTCSVGRREYDPIFQYWPIRFIFPAFSVPLYLWAARRGALRAWAAVGVFAGLALMWNLDSGIAVAGATLFTLGCEGLWAKPARGALAVMAVVGGMAATAGLFLLCLHIQAGWREPFHRTSDYQRLFYVAGFCMEPMPLAPHPWWVVVAGYLTGLGLGIQRRLAGRRDAATRLLLFLSILGIGLFTYYQGRSVDINLVNASWPAMLLAAMLADRVLRAVRARLLAPAMCWTLLPPAYLGVLALAMMPGVLIGMAALGPAQWRLALAARATGRAAIMDRRVDFIRAHVGGDADCEILAQYQAVYFMETGFRSSLDGPGLTEIFFMTDLDELRSGLMREPPRHLFIDEATAERLELREAIDSRFRVVATFPDGKLVYLEPR